MDRTMDFLLQGMAWGVIGAALVLPFAERLIRLVVKSAASHAVVLGADAIRGGRPMSSSNSEPLPRPSPHVPARST